MFSAPVRKKALVVLYTRPDQGRTDVPPEQLLLMSNEKRCGDDGGTD
jgi:hypothetical protein